MKKLLTIIFAVALGLNLSAQEVVVEYPYNPDFENDGNVGVEDLMQLLSGFGLAFEADELVIDNVTLSDWLQIVSSALMFQEETIDSLANVVATMQTLDSADSSGVYTAHFIFEDPWGSWETIEIEAPLTNLIICVSENPSSYKSADLILPTSDVPNGYMLTVLNSNHHPYVDVEPMNGSTNDGVVRIGTIAKYAFYEGVWYPTYVPG